MSCCVRACKYVCHGCVIMYVIPCVINVFYSVCKYVCHTMCYYICHTVCRCVCISLQAADDTDVVLALSYVVSSASWSPQYDLRVFSSDKTMKASLYLRSDTDF